MGNFRRTARKIRLKKRELCERIHRSSNIKGLKKNIEFYGKVIKALENPKNITAFAKGEIPYNLKPISYKGTLAQLSAELMPIEPLLRMGIYLPQLNLKKKGNYLLYLFYWQGGMYFVPVHATFVFSREKLLDWSKRAHEIRAGDLAKKHIGLLGEKENLGRIDALVKLLKNRNGAWRARAGRLERRNS